MSIDDILAVRDRHSITEVLSRLGVEPPARWNGTSDYMVSCPTPGHEDSTPSCIVHPSTDRYFCFGCGAHGDVLQLVQDVRGRSPLRDVVAFLDGAPVHVRGGRPTPPSVEPAPTRTALERNLEVNALAWRELTTPPAAATARGYLRRRGLDVTELERVDGGPLVGYTPAHRDGLVRRLLDAGCTRHELVDAGWALDVDGRLIDRFHRRVVMPVKDSNGEVRGVIARDISEHAARRYLNTPSTAAYRKGDHLYSPLPLTRDAVSIVVCEGPIDALALAATAQRHSTEVNVCALAGTALTELQAQLIRAGTRGRVVLCADADEAGAAATRAWNATLKRAGVSTVEVVRPPDRRDLAEWLSGAARMPPALARSLSI